MNDTTQHDVIIIGAGPAGLQAADQLVADGLNVKILERGEGVGTFFRKFPRHRTFISINKAHTGLSLAEQRLRFDWNSLLSDDGPLFPDYSKKYFPPADVFVEYMELYANRLQDVIACNTEVSCIARAGEDFVLTCTDGTVYEAGQVIVATGVSIPWVPDVDGFEHVELYADFDPDPERYTDKRVLILGKGNSAFETADSLIETTQAIHVMSPNPVKFAWNTHFVGHLRAVNNNFLDTYQLKSQNALLDATPTKIERHGDEIIVTAAMGAAEGHEIVLAYDHVIACTGFRFDASILDDTIKPEMKHFGKFPAMTSNWECPSVPGLWFAGTITQSNDFKKTMSGFVHGFRHNVASLATFVAARAKGASYPTDVVPMTTPDLADEIRDRISVSAAMFLQPGFLGDVIRLDGPNAGTRHSDVPVAWVKENLLGSGDHLMITLEFGNFGDNPMHVKRQHTIEGTPDPFIHPVLRHYRDGKLLATTHLSDHLDSDWRDPDQRDPGTVQAMTYIDQGQTLSPHEAAKRQLMAFLLQQEIGGASMNMAAAE